jgi:hypothetical protein
MKVLQRPKHVGFNARVCGVWVFWVKTENGVASPQEKHWASHAKRIAIKPIRQLFLTESRRDL